MQDVLIIQPMLHVSELDNMCARCIVLTNVNEPVGLCPQKEPTAVFALRSHCMDFLWANSQFTHSQKTHVRHM